MKAVERRARGELGPWVLPAVVGLCALFLLAALLGPTLLQGPLYDSRPSGVPCDELPTRQQVQTALEVHADVVRRIEAVGDQVSVTASQPCASHPGRAEVLVVYPGGDDREDIQAILADDDLGVPVSLRNT
ncbi:hypothetical protein [Cellulomonas xiejunii]|uniref:Uncharacterized protein n=1 Tax=Cellulomonas xiejunii TaxID=2968083 RepID=A0ABY5KM49_9CELL|nr:hypothetical protein [Cellulomonas xiejunii]MCC2315541.1 hypothetical protein [Cellulomonas xiejunii]MCC2320705.1 hypothetical protein [Cellulomonas xiejunii]UUI70993.1 hypothetical protein NP048_14505 [Cellulomonas xiejunii]